MSDVAGELDQLRIALGEVDVLATLTKAAYDWLPGEDADAALLRIGGSGPGDVPRRAVAVRGQAPFRELGAGPRPQGVAYAPHDRSVREAAAPARARRRC
jgi:hypothetical protein